MNKIETDDNSTPTQISAHLTPWHIAALDAFRSDDKRNRSAALMVLIEKEYMRRLMKEQKRAESKKVTK